MCPGRHRAAIGRSENAVTRRHGARSSQSRRRVHDDSLLLKSLPLKVPLHPIKFEAIHYNNAARIDCYHENYERHENRARGDPAGLIHGAAPPHLCEQGKYYHYHPGHYSIEIIQRCVSSIKSRKLNSRPFSAIGVTRNSEPKQF
ncbi:hypothetical protein EVAR_18619_1 [Eumeta japonica]|uniref:Uncharacterized protein n=1 Tax=Eumeta variegata TaxID=151549 RepID=A0A4C1U6U0_EUMVA|nr:hypothetical protein EVAR_18619_1 [Eumeta japonica]